MDDFGTGYSSLQNLRSFPFDKIKIDQSFVSDLERRPDAPAIIRAVLGLGQSLGMITCAEGVETPEQVAYLREEGCTEVQGYYYGKPAPVDDAIRLLNSGLAKAQRACPQGIPPAGHTEAAPRPEPGTGHPDPVATYITAVTTSEGRS
jgi:EAL domain-containing protein (putative c-di-GMP-specific phosphodiesterase class I)